MPAFIIIKERATLDACLCVISGSTGQNLTWRRTGSFWIQDLSFQTGAFTTLNCRGNAIKIKSCTNSGNASEMLRRCCGEDADLWMCISEKYNQRRSAAHKMCGAGVKDILNSDSNVRLSGGPRRRGCYRVFGCMQHKSRKWAAGRFSSFFSWRMSGSVFFTGFPC